MAKGYHSRSPEELREFLNKVNRPQKKRRWIQIVLYIDIFILMVVFYFVAKNSDPSLGHIGKKSNKVIENQFQIYFEKSKEDEKDSANYFLFVKNQSDKTLVFPENLAQKFEYKIKSSKGLVCVSNNLNFDKKSIGPNETEFFPFSISKKNFQELPKDCMESLTEASRGFRKFFPSKKSLGVFSITKENKYTEILLENDTLEKIE